MILYTVSFVCEKGGVGKTMLADELYYALKRDDIPTSLYSLDGQYVSRSKRDANPDVVILDTAGSLDDKFRDVVRKSDLLVVPVRPSLNDIEPFTRTLDLIESMGDTPIFIVVNAWTPFTMAKKFMEWLESKDFGYPVFVIPQSEALAQTIGSGHSVFGLDKYGKVSGALDNLFVAIYRELGLS